MSRQHNIKSKYVELKNIYKELKNKKPTEEDEAERFEDVPEILSEKDREGSYKMTSYMEFYQMLKFFIDTEEQVQPSGMVSKHKDYVR
tara:strand:- start:699 stop:962 length:264 start_codon:yes stop_codon:yes gene_type:complete